MKYILIIVIVMIMVSGRVSENRNPKPAQVEPTAIVQVEPTVIPTNIPQPSCYEELSKAIKEYKKTREDPEKMYAVGDTCTDDVIMRERLKLGVITNDDDILNKFVTKR